MLYRYIFRVRWQVIAFAGVVLAAVALLDGCASPSAARENRAKTESARIMQHMTGNASDAMRNFTLDARPKTHKIPATKH